MPASCLNLSGSQRLISVNGAISSSGLGKADDKSCKSDVSLANADQPREQWVENLLASHCQDCPGKIYQRTQRQQEHQSKLIQHEGEYRDRRIYILDES